LASIERQTRKPDEIVIGDDRSDDETFSIAESFARSSDLVVRALFNTERLGSSANFERALARCNGDIVVLCDQDDVWRHDKLEKIEAAFAANPDASYVFSNGSLIDGDGQPLKGSLWQRALFNKQEQQLFASGHGLDVLLRHNVVTGAAMTVMRKGIEAALPIPPGWIHDYWLALMLESSGRGIPIDEPLISYRRQASQQVGLFRLSVPYAIAAVGRHDESYYASEAAGLGTLIDRLGTLGVPSEIVNRIREKMQFSARRAQMRKSPDSALGAILASWWRGDYRRYTPRPAVAPPMMALDVAASLRSLLRPRGR
jgi:glycosyltransferase involved in cell wall biosynthesis